MRSEKLRHSSRQGETLLRSKITRSEGQNKKQGNLRRKELQKIKEGRKEVKEGRHCRKIKAKGLPLTPTKRRGRQLRLGFVRGSPSVREKNFYGLFMFLFTMVSLLVIIHNHNNHT